MRDIHKTKQQLITELEEIRHHVTQLDLLGSKSGTEIQQLIDAFPFYVMLVSADHHILLANEMVKQTLGIDPKHIIGGYCPKVVHGLDSPFHGCPLEEAKEVGHGIERDLFDSGSGRWVRSSAFPSSLRTHDDQTIFIHFTQDITEHKQTEEEIRRNFDIQQVLNSLLHLSLQDISLEGILGKALELILSIPWLALESRGAIFLVEDDPEVLVMKAQNKLAKPIQEACARLPFGRCLCGRAALTQGIQFADHIDERHDIRYEGIIPHGHYCVPILFAGKTLGVINTYLGEGHRSEQRELEFIAAVANTLAGIIVRKRVEEDLARTNAELKSLNLQLETRVEERTKQLEEAVQVAEAASRVKSDFLTSMSHELRTPLTSIIGFSQVLQEQYFGNLNEKQSEYVSDILGSGEHLLSLINDILDLSKVEADKMELELSGVKIKGLLESSLVMIKEKALVHGINLSIHTTGDLEGLEIMADERKLKQVMFNLLSNAAKFTPDGGSITVEGRTKGNEIVISVSDTGIGIAPKDMEKLFEKFYQASGSLKDKTPGTGLGLSLTKAFLEMHGGKIWAESKGVGKGSRFTFTLPIMPTSSEGEQNGKGNTDS